MVIIKTIRLTNLRRYYIISSQKKQSPLAKNFEILLKTTDEHGKRRKKWNKHKFTLSSLLSHTLWR